VKTLQIRDLDETTYNALAAAADRERRSLSGQAGHVLAEVLTDGTDNRARRSQLLAQLRAAPPFTLSEDCDTPEDIIRSDRNR